MTLHELHKQYLFDHTGIDRIIEDRGILNGWHECYSEFVTSQGGDVTVYRVYGTILGHMRISIH